MKAIILCGGQGTRLREHTAARPKPMVEIGQRPILWHIMKLYAHVGITDFVLCLGYMGQMIKDYFLHYEAMNSDFTIELGRQTSVAFHSATHDEHGWKVTLVDTGESAMTGARVKRASRYLDPGETFALTYGDGLTDVDLHQVLAYHRSHSGLATVTGVRPPSRFGELSHDGGRVLAYAEKPQVQSGLINGGFFFLEPEFLDYLSEEDGCVLEREPMEKCTADGKLFVYPHDGFWQCMDTLRDWERLDELWRGGNAPWTVWS